MQTKDKELILLSFDTEEFDVPREHGVNISLEEGMRVSVEGTTRILDCLKRNGVCATPTRATPSAASRWNTIPA